MYHPANLSESFYRYIVRRLTLMGLLRTISITPAACKIDAPYAERMTF